MHSIGNLSSIPSQYQVSKLLEVIKGSDRGSQLSGSEQAVVTLAKIAAEDYSIEPSDLSKAKSFFLQEGHERS